MPKKRFFPGAGTGPCLVSDAGSPLRWLSSGSGGPRCTRAKIGRLLRHSAWETGLQLKTKNIEDSRISF